MVYPHCNLKGEWQRNLSCCSSVATIFFSTCSLSLRRLERANHRGDTGRYCYHYSYNDKVYGIISLCCSSLFCRGILISFGMSENKSYIVRQELSLATKIKGPSRDLSTTSEYETVRAVGQTQGWKEQLLCRGSEQSTTPMHLFMLRPY